MHRLALASALALATLLAPLARGPQEGAAAGGARAAAAAPIPFPLPAGALRLELDAAGEAPTLEALVDAYARSTSQYVHYASDTRQVLAQRRVPLQHPVVVPPAEVQSFLEHLLWENRIVLSLLRAEEPRMLGLASLQTNDRGWIGPWTFVPPERASQLAAHAALAVSTLVPLQNVDARQVAGSMRALVVDGSSQMVLAVGDGNSIYLHGRGSDLARWVSLLRLTDEHAGGVEQEVER